MLRTRILLILLISLPAIAEASFLDAHPKGFTSAKVCGKCHAAIYEGWKGSMHANAVRDPIFRPIFREVSERTEGKIDSLCLSCHAPTTRATGKFDLADPITSEGVTCDFCHSVKGVNLSSSLNFEFETSNKKWGPLKEVSSPAHDSGYAKVFEQSRFCGVCHEFTSESGVPILETYSEWMASPQAKKGQTCQTCHMAPIKGLVVPTRIQPTRETYIHSHEAPGGHSVETLKKAVALKIGKASRAGEKAHVVVYLENVGSGHKVPTGIPTRKLVLEFTALLGGTKIYETKRVFQKVLVDANGKVIKKDSDLFLTAAKVKQDNRLEPGKVRSEHFSFYAPKGKPVQIEASLYYVYQPRLIEEIEMKVELDSKKTGIPVK